MSAWISYLRRSLSEVMCHHPLARAVAARLLHARAALVRRSPTRRLMLLARSAHICPDARGLERIFRALRGQLEQIEPGQIDWDLLGVSTKSDIPKGILLKPPVSAREKGVLHIAFEDQWLRLMRGGRAGAIAREYDLILGPSWSPPPEPATLAALRVWPGTLYTLMSNLDDLPRMKAISERLVPIPLLASSWVDPQPFEEHLGGPRDLDIVMLANFALFKRHWLFFDVLRKLPRRMRVCLMGVPMSGRSEMDLRREARSFGVEDRFQLIVRPSRAEIARTLARARTSLIFSRREGSCIAVVESFFADTPVGLFEDAHIGSKAFIGPQTGMLLTRRYLASQIEKFVERSPRYSPRAWALKHLSCHRSGEILNQALREAALREGRPWTRDITPFQGDTVFRYLTREKAEEMAPWIDAFSSRHGLQLGRGLPALPAPAAASVADRPLTGRAS